MLNRWLLFILLFCSSSYAAPENQGKGKITVSGEIVESACTISTDDIWQEIDFGNLSLGEFADGNTPASKPLSIQLINCTLDKKNGGVWSSASITFDGERDEHSKNMFAVTGDGKGVAINLTDINGNKAIPGQPLPAVAVQEDKTNLTFNLFLERNGDVLTPGKLSSFIRFMVSYQ
ncbi:fimbrial protein [Klebsiella pneumoniae]|uniref:fimbrial protein n=1 Tax=Klebsiella pneumoniae TaxID=573 RepID=UPI0039B5C77E